MAFLNFITRRSEHEEIGSLLATIKKERCINQASNKGVCGEIFKFVGCATSSKDHKPADRDINDRRHKAV
jgi:hypothetical protein